VLAARRVDAGLSQHQALDWPSPHDVRVDDFVHVGEGYAAIPHRFGIDHQVWAMLALVQASGLIRPHSAFQSALCQFLLEQFLQFGLGPRIAAPPRMPWWALVSANENMFLKLGHENNVQDGAELWRCTQTPNRVISTRLSFLALRGICSHLKSRKSRFLASKSGGMTMVGLKRNGDGWIKAE
jgi:hypothetical protein